MNIFKREQPTFETLVTKEIDLTARIATTHNQLAEAERTAGEAFLDDERAGEAAIGEVVRLRAGLDALTRAIAAIREKREPLILESFKSEAAQVRAKAAAKSRELSALREETQALLNRLATLHDVPYFREGVLMSQVDENTRGVFDPKFRRLEFELQQLETNALIMENAPVPEFGHVDLGGVTSMDAVVKAVLETRSFGPTARAVMDWIRAVEIAAKRTRHIEFGEAERRVRLEWDAGGIKKDASYVYVPTVATKKVPALALVEGLAPSGAIDPASATFRAPAEPMTLQERDNWQVA